MNKNKDTNTSKLTPDFVTIPNLDGLSEADRRELQGILAGRAIPPLHSDVIAKRVFDADIHPDRLNFLLRAIAKDETIEVRSSAKNEGFRSSLNTKTMITDIPSWLRDSRLADLEIQTTKQNFIITRVELYASDMLLLQYTVEQNQPKSSIQYSNVNEVLVVVLMVNSPNAFLEYDKISDRYIHRFTRMTADTGLSHPLKAKIIYVQLDKCFRQFQAGTNAEAQDLRPDRLQIWLSNIFNANDSQASAAANGDDALLEIRKEALQMAQDKEVQTMLIQEKYDMMDWYSSLAESRAEGRAEVLGIAKEIPHLRQDGKTDPDIVLFLMTKYDMTQPEAETILSCFSS